MKLLLQNVRIFIIINIVDHILLFVPEIKNKKKNIYFFNVSNIYIVLLFQLVMIYTDIILIISLYLNWYY